MKKVNNFPFTDLSVNILSAKDAKTLTSLPNDRYYFSYFANTLLIANTLHIVIEIGNDKRRKGKGKGCHQADL